ncbi:hypothetical protein [Lacticaseibacillus sp. GG6-2]
MVAVLTRAFNDATVERRLANFSGLPTTIVEHVFHTRLRETFAAARVGMTTVTYFQARFNASDQLLNVTATSNADDSAVGADASFSNTDIDQLLVDARKLGAKGWYLEDAKATCLYIHEDEQDIILVCE